MKQKDKDLIEENKDNKKWIRWLNKWNNYKQYIH